MTNEYGKTQNTKSFSSQLTREEYEILIPGTETRKNQLNCCTISMPQWLGCPPTIETKFLREGYDIKFLRVISLSL